MAYTGFPATYPQYYPQYPTTQQNTGIIWMQGIEAARAYPVAPNGQVVLFDSEQQCIYLKTADAQGRPSMRILDYTIRSEAPKTAQNALSGTNTDIPTRQDLNALQGQIDALKQQIERLGHESTLSADATTAKQQSTATVSAVHAAVSGGSATSYPTGDEQRKV